jgi:2-oxoglutarate dehydrogenase E1 component
MEKFSYLGNADISSIEALYQQYMKDNSSVDFGWQKFFEGFEFSRKSYDETSKSSEIPDAVRKEFAVINLINGFRSRGHLFTLTNPVRERRKYFPPLEVEHFGLAQADMDTVFHAGSQIGLGPAKLRDIVAHLKQTYCRSIGAEFKYVRHPKVIEWLQTKMETSKNTPNFSKKEKLTILDNLNKAVEFENFLHTKFVGQKRFSLEGGDAVIPAMEALLEKGADMGIKDYVVGMAHRGRLGILTNVLGKRYEELFAEFEGYLSDDTDFGGDVKYHQGFSSDRVTEQGNKFHISLIPNPSHLETVDPVVEGSARAKIDMFHGGDNNKVCPILIHGDAALAGQGITYEVIQMSLLEGYQTGGTIHIVINNQVGFTTNYLDARSSTYCTDVAKVTLSPVFHVNGDDTEAVVYAVQMAMEYRQKFHKDVFIDVLCYRKYGHNEGDEPRFTQPLLYKAIAAHPNPKDIYVKKLTAEGVIDEAYAKEIQKKFRDQLQEKLDLAKQKGKSVLPSYLESQWSKLKPAEPAIADLAWDTKVSKKSFTDIAKKITTLPKDKKFFNKTEKLFADRIAMIEEDKYDWAMGELMAYATLMNEGNPVRFSGQDVQRGTFSHRHAVVRVEDSEEQYTPINNIGTDAKLAIYNSHLSEYGVLGFEFGYSLTAPFTLTIWEAQFGDFFNGAQIIIDQYITASEYKWKRMSGLVVLLPHGYEGMGPEHSSARVERFLQQCAEDNMQVVNCTTPANQFHALRRQIKRDFRKPLICFTPKKLLRYPACVSSLKEFTDAGFHEVIDDITAEAKSVKKVVFCTGKIFYDLIEIKKKEAINDIAIVRIEQLYPFPVKQVNEIIAKYKGASEFVWAQEEPENMGAWVHMFMAFRGTKLPQGKELKYVGRKASASPATGYSKLHAQQEKEIFSQVFTKQAVVSN